MLQRPPGLMLDMKYAETAFTDLNYSNPEHVRARVDLTVTAQGEFKTSVTYVIKKELGSSGSERIYDPECPKHISC
jgi:hypothetical protein